MAWIIYFFGMVDNVIDLSNFFAIFSGIAFTISFILKLVLEAEEAENVDREIKATKKCLNIVIIIFIPALLISAFAPSSKTIAAMYIVPKLANNEHLENIGDKAMTVMEKKLDEWAAGLTAEKPEKKK